MTDQPTTPPPVLKLRPGCDEESELIRLVRDGAAKPPLDEPEQLEPDGEAPTGKRCATCGMPGLMLGWRPADAGASSPLGQPAWFPTTPVREAKMWCPRDCMPTTAYGLLVGGRRDADGLVVGEFLLRDPRETVVW